MWRSFSISFTSEFTVNLNSAEETLTTCSVSNIKPRNPFLKLISSFESGAEREMDGGCWKGEMMSIILPLSTELQNALLVDEEFDDLSFWHRKSLEIACSSACCRDEWPIMTRQLMVVGGGAAALFAHLVQNNVEELAVPWATKLSGEECKRVPFFRDYSYFLSLSLLRCRPPPPF